MRRLILANFGHRTRLRQQCAIALAFFTLSSGFFEELGYSEDKPRQQAPSDPAENDQVRGFRTETLRGRVVWLAPALEQKFGIQSVPEAQERVLAIETDDGRLWPIVEDIRGRSFRLDPRLRKPHLELLVRRFVGSPAVQVIRIYEVTADGKYELDYWCEICSIAMFELKECECCQGEIELRRRKAPGR